MKRNTRDVANSDSGEAAEIQLKLTFRIRLLLCQARN